MSEMQFDMEGDGYAETLAYDDGDGVYEYVAVDSNLDGIADTHILDSDENGIAELVVQDLDNDGVFESSASLPNGYALTISSGPIDISGASGIVAAAEGMMAPHFQNGGLAVPTDTPAPQRFDSYNSDADGDSIVDAMDANPTRYDTP